MLKSSRHRINSGLDTAMIFSSTEENLQSDLMALKASFLYAENIQLASARLYHALFLMHEYRNDARYREVLQGCLDNLIAKCRRSGIKRNEKELRQYLDELEGVACIDGINQEKPNIKMVNILPPDEGSISAAIELAEGLDRDCFSIVSYDDVVQKSLDFIYGNVPTLEVIPVVDQDTLDQLEGFTRFSLGGRELDIPGPLADPEDRSPAYKAWAANALLGSMPQFPATNWNDLSEVRDQLRNVRKTFLSAMNDLCQDFGTGGRPDKIAEFLSEKRLIIEANLEEIGRQLEEERSSSRLVGAGLPQLAMGIGLAVTGLVEHQMPYWAICASGTGGAAIALAVQQVAQEADARRKIRDKAKSHPYWLLYHASECWEPPTWPSTRPAPCRSASRQAPRLR